MIRIENLSLNIKKAKILENINLEFESGKIHGLIGRNGSGKTMLMKCICGFVRPTEGRVLVNEKVIGDDVDFPENIGIIIETPEFVPYLSGYENLKMLAGCRKKIGKEQICEAMEQVELDWKNKLHVKKYSLGMRQRLGLAQAIMEKPEILVLDEPFNGLDDDGVSKMRELLLKKKEEGITVIISSHNTEDIQILCDTVHRLYRGKVVESCVKDGSVI